MKWWRRRPRPVIPEIPSTVEHDRLRAYEEAVEHEKAKATWLRTQASLRRLYLLEAEADLLARQGGSR